MNTTSRLASEAAAGEILVSAPAAQAAGLDTSGLRSHALAQGQGSDGRRLGRWRVALALVQEPAQLVLDELRPAAGARERDEAAPGRAQRHRGRRPGRA